MTGQTFERSRVEPIPFPLHPRSAGGGANASSTAFSTMSGSLAFPKTKALPGRVVSSALGCLRGLCWGVVIECALAFGAYEVWHLWRFLR